jgi:hypothetical protein
MDIFFFQIIMFNLIKCVVITKPSFEGNKIIVANIVQSFFFYLFIYKKVTTVRCLNLLRIILHIILIFLCRNLLIEVYRQK